MIINIVILKILRLVKILHLIKAPSILMFMIMLYFDYIVDIELSYLFKLAYFKNRQFRISNIKQILAPLEKVSIDPKGFSGPPFENHCTRVYISIWNRRSILI